MRTFWIIWKSLAFLMRLLLLINTVFLARVVQEWTHASDLLDYLARSFESVFIKALDLVEYLPKSSFVQSTQSSWRSGWGSVNQFSMTAGVANHVAIVVVFSDFGKKRAVGKVIAGCATFVGAELKS